MDVCVSLTTPPFIALVGSLLKRFRRTSLAIWSMDLYPEVLAAFGVVSPTSHVYRFLATLSERLYRRSDAILSLGDVMTTRLAEAGADVDKITTVHNWVPGEVVRPLESEHVGLRHKWGLADKTVLMYSGNLGVGHELDTVVHAMATLDERVNLFGVFVGHGRMRQPLVGLVRALGLTNVQFRPPQPLNELSQTLATGDIHVVSQRLGTEGLIVPSKLYGILAAARPVIYVGPANTEVGQIIRDGGGGMIVPNGDVAALADALTRLAGDARQRKEMGRQGQDFYRRHLGRKRSVERIVRIIEDLPPKSSDSRDTEPPDHCSPETPC
jgi:glycosyltransferase involved in cell wall biosynthesis